MTMSNSPITPQEAFDLALIAFGSGTGGIYVKPEVASKLRTAFFANFETQITNDPTQWENQKLFVLECARTVGRLAAQNAISRGSMAIIWSDDAKKAVQYVVQRYGGPVPGGWCQM